MTIATYPTLIAHRGACNLAPENTLAAFELATTLGADGLETDIQISLDGVPFLMHDTTLGRTTDIHRLYPGRTRQSASRFTWLELQRLDAGAWFDQRGPIDPGQGGRSRYAGERIPQLGDVLEVVRRASLAFIFDLRRPPTDHPFHREYFDVVFKTIKAARIDEQVWFLVGPRRAAWLRNTTPAMRRVVGADGHRPPDAQGLVNHGYQAVNIDLAAPGEAIAAYRRAGLWVNVYVVDDPDIAQALVADGVTSLTTNNLQEMGPWAARLGTKED